MKSISFLILCHMTAFAPIGFRSRMGHIIILNILYCIKYRISSKISDAQKIIIFPDGRNSTVQKNNYDFDKVTVVEIQEGSKY